MNKDEPFKSWQPPGTKIRADMYDLCFCAATGYLFYYFYVLVYKRYGTEVATMIREEHVDGLNRVSPGFGDQLSGILATIENGLESSARTPYVLPDTGEEMPPEFYIAHHFLFTVNESPFYGKLSTLKENEGLPTVEAHDAIFDVAECLVWNRDRGISQFTNVLDAMSIDARKLNQWVDERKTTPSN